MAVSKDRVQRTVYLDPDVSRCMDHVAVNLDVTLSEALNHGLRLYLESILTTDERRVFRFEGLPKAKTKVKR